MNKHININSGVIIFSRYDSSRLPGKALIDLEGRVLLQRVIDRARLISGSHRIIVATSNRTLEQPIIDCARSEGVDVFQGDLDNVAQRAYDCALEFNLDYFARVCGDRPFFDPGLVSFYMDRAMQGEFDLVTNVIGSTFPPGITTEIVSTDSLARVLDLTQEKEDLEHVTRYFYLNKDQFTISNQYSNETWRDVSLVVDTTADLERARFIIRKLGTNPERAAIAQIVAEARLWYAMNPKEILTH